MQNISLDAGKDGKEGDGKPHHTKGKGGATHKEQQKHLYDAKSDTAEKINGYNGYSAYTGPTQVSGSSGFTWVKRRKPEASSILSDGSRSKISAMDPTFAKGTYELTKHRMDVSERKHNNHNASHRDETSKYARPKYPGRNVQSGSFDVADIYSSNYYMDFDLADKPDTHINAQVSSKSSNKFVYTNDMIKIHISLLIFLQDHTKYGEPVELSVPTMTETNKNDELNWNENTKWRQSLRKSRLGRGKETFLV